MKLKALLEKIIVRLCYNDFNRAEFFRKQGAVIGIKSRLLVKSLGTEPYLVKIGDNVTISSDVFFSNHDGAVSIFRNEIPDINVFGTIEIKDNCFIGTRVILLKNITIGPNSIVGAGSVVTKDVPSDSVVAGVPARVICSIQEYKQKSIEDFKALNLKGPKDTWKEQLVKHFWG